MHLIHRMIGRANETQVKTIAITKERNLTVYEE